MKPNGTTVYPKVAMGQSLSVNSAGVDRIDPDSLHSLNEANKKLNKGAKASNQKKFPK